MVKKNRIFSDHLCISSSRAVGWSVTPIFYFRNRIYYSLAKQCPLPESFLGLNKILTEVLVGQENWKKSQFWNFFPICDTFYVCKLKKTQQKENSIIIMFISSLLIKNIKCSSYLSDWSGEFWSNKSSYKSIQNK